MSPLITERAIKSMCEYDRYSLLRRLELANPKTFQIVYEPPRIFRRGIWWAFYE